MQNQIDKLNAKLGEIKTEEEVQVVEEKPEEVVKKQGLAERLTDNITSKMPYATDEQKHKASQIITHLLAKVSANPSVFQLFIAKENIADAVRIVTQIVNMDLPLTGDMYYVIPYKGKLSLQISYQGMLEIAYRAGVYNVQVNTVYDGDEFDYYYSSTNYFIHKPKRQTKDAIAYYATCKVVMGKDTDLLISVMSKDEAMEFKAKYARGNPLWNSEFEKMAKKTVLKQLLRMCPKRNVDLNVEAEDENEE